MRLTPYALAVCLLATPASAGVVAHVDNASQRMVVSVNGSPVYSWPVSTARKGYRTPVGTYRVQRMARMWYSRKYDMSPMPHSLFFRGGYAIHGTNSVRNLGRPASHGCVRLSPGNASMLYSLVQRYGGARIVVTNGGRAAYANLRGSHLKRAHLTGGHTRGAFVRRAHQVRSAHLRSHRMARVHRARTYRLARLHRSARIYRAAAPRPSYYPVRAYSNPYSGWYSPFGYWY